MKQALSYLKKNAPPGALHTTEREAEVEAALTSLEDCTAKGTLVCDGALRVLLAALPVAYQDALDRALSCRNGIVTDFNPATLAARGCN